ncbi:MAG: hypothetical protein WC341_00650 [Bacteroidales bacterium]|jgi:hypothetical protein
MAEASKKRSNTPNNSIKNANKKPNTPIKIVPADPPKRVIGVPFEKGDKRINRRGRPKTFEALRKTAIKMLNESIKSSDGKIDISHLELILKDWLNSQNFQKQQAIIHTAYGKVPDSVQMTVDLKALSDAQLRRLAKGEDIISVLTHPNQ